MPTVIEVWHIAPQRGDINRWRIGARLTVGSITTMATTRTTAMTTPTTHLNTGEMRRAMPIAIKRAAVPSSIYVSWTQRRAKIAAAIDANTIIAPTPSSNGIPHQRSFKSTGRCELRNIVALIPKKKTVSITDNPMASLILCLLARMPNDVDCFQPRPEGFGDQSAVEDFHHLNSGNQAVTNYV
jgi:hypothetical protein